MATAPAKVAPHYGFLWWVARDGRAIFPSAPEGSYFALGNGGNVIWIWPDADSVVVTRWLDFAVTDQFLQKIQAALVAKP
jgi:hypothetical protein